MALGFVEIGPNADAYEYGVLVTSLEEEVLTLAQLYRDRADSENPFDELKNQWGWAGFTTRDLPRCQLMARFIALIYNWWSVFVRLAEPDRHLEAVTSRPLLLSAIAENHPQRPSNHAESVKLPCQGWLGRKRTLKHRAFSARAHPKCGAVDGKPALAPDTLTCRAILAWRAATASSATPHDAGMTAKSHISRLRSRFEKRGRRINRRF
jgi:hypothetical protein